MKAMKRRDKVWLLKTARAVAAELKQHIEGTPLRVRLPGRATSTETDGWAARIGDLGKNRLGLEIWLDRFSGHQDRKLNACFAGNRRQLITLTEQVAKKLVPVRVITGNDTNDDGYLVLTKPLRRDEFNQPIFEKHPYGETYFGIYDLTRRSSERISPHFLARAVAFFESVARSLRHAKPEDDTQDIYPRVENRQRVASHLRRERSRFLAMTRKIMDNYECQVCGLRFEDRYGNLGIEFAEAHHSVPLSQLRENVKTRIEDLVTVCANCHRMLHRMEGKRDDLKNLRAIVRRLKAKRS